MIESDKVKVAAKLFLLSPRRGTDGFTELDMMVYAGVHEEFALTTSHQDAFSHEHGSLIQQMPKSVRQNDPESQLRHFKSLNRYLPTTPIPELLRMIGCKDEEIFKKGGKNRGGTNLHMNCRNFRARENKEANTDDSPAVSIDTSLQSPASAMTEISTLPSEVSEITKLSFFGSPHETSRKRSSAESKSNDEELPRLESDQGMDRSIEQHFTEKTRRKNSDQAQRERALKQNMRETRVAAHKVGSILYQTVDSQRNQLTRFKSAASCATLVNQMFGFSDCVSGDQLIRAVKTNQVGKSPPRRGNPGLIPCTDVQDLAVLVCTMSAIEQSNVQKRMTRAETVSMIGMIVNQKLVADDRPPIADSWQFYDRIQQMNAMKQSACLVDQREARRVLWLTIQNAKSHYQKWEDFLVEKGFARQPLSLKEKHQKGNVVYYQDQLHRIAIFDECKISLDGSSTENAGGRPSATPSSNEVNEAGAPTMKSGDSVTLMTCAIGTEIVPPLIMHPSNNVKRECKLPIKNVESFQQVRGQCGFPAPRWHDCMFACSKKGGMNKVIFDDCINNHALPLIPDLADIDGKRVVMKADMGPGRTAIDFLASAHVAGAHFFPGMPNSTETMQEMDQIFGAFKSAVHNNRKHLFEARMKEEGGLSATLSHADIGWLIFGGDVKVSNGSSVKLQSAFLDCLSEDHLRDAYHKCGYCPATRAPLKSERLRYEVVDECGLDVDDESELDLAEEASIRLLEWFESTNHNAVDELIGKGYKLAKEGRRFVNRITKEQIEGRAKVATSPGTRERQDALAKAKYSGEFFHIHGGVLNTADLLIGKERKLMTERAQDLQKVKERYVKAEAIAQEYNALMSSGRNESSWSSDDLRIATMRHHGIEPAPKGETNLKGRGMSTKKLKDLYVKKHMNQNPPPSKPWTPAMESNLRKLERGEINSVQETSMCDRAVKRNEDCIVIRLKAISEPTRISAMLRLNEDLEQEAKNRLIDALHGADAHIDETDPFDACPDEADEPDAILEESDDDSSEIDDNLLASDKSESSEGSAPSPFKRTIRTRSVSKKQRSTRSNSQIDDSNGNLVPIDAGYVDLLAKRKESEKQEQLQNELEARRDDLEEARDRLSKKKRCKKSQAMALILSKGFMPPDGASRPMLDRIWNEHKSKPNWSRSVHLSKSEKEKLKEIEESEKALFDW